MRSVAQANQYEDEVEGNQTSGALLPLYYLAFHISHSLLLLSSHQYFCTYRAGPGHAPRTP